MLPIGTLLNGGRYKIVKHLSSGGFGKTYVVEKVFQKGELYAMKEFFIKGINARNGNTVIVSNDENEETFNHQKEKFLTEAERLRDVDNEHIVRVHDFFSDNGTCYYVMDLIDGESLNTVKKPLKEDKVWDILNQVLDALSAIHQKKTIDNKKERIWLHLDIKPANLMIDKNGIVTLIDFGASKLLSAKDSNSSISMSQISFTKGYAPIEQTSQRIDSIGPWTDFYALGATLYKLLTEKDSVIPEYSELNEYLYSDDDIMKAFKFPKNISEKMRNLIVWMMNPNRKKRPQSVEEVRAFLNDSNDVGAENEPEEDSEVTVFGDFHNSNKKTSFYIVFKKTLDNLKNKIHHLVNILKSHKYYIVFVISVVVAFSALCIVFFNENNIVSPNQNSNVLFEQDNEIVKDIKRLDSIANTMIILDTTKLYKSVFFNSKLGHYLYYGLYDEDGQPNDSFGEARFEDELKGPYEITVPLNHSEKGGKVYSLSKMPVQRHLEPRMYRGPFAHGKMEGENAVYKNGDWIFEGEFRDGRPYKGKLLQIDFWGDRSKLFIGLFADDTDDINGFKGLKPYKGYWYDKNGNKL